MSDYTPLKKINALIQGPPRTGKSTLVAKLCSMLETKGYNIGGIQTPEIREKNRRVGFWVVDLHTEKKEILAHVEIKSRFRVSKYGVDLNSFNELAITAIKSAIENYNIVVIDEIGKMELFSHKFVNKIEEIFNKSNKKILATIPVSKILLIEKLKKLPDTEVIEITEENRDRLVDELINKLD